MVNEVSAGGRAKRLCAVTTVRQPVSARVVWSSRSGDLIHRSRQAGWGLARCSTDRLSRRSASPIRTRRMGSARDVGRKGCAKQTSPCQFVCVRESEIVRPASYRPQVKTAGGPSSRWGSCLVRVGSVDPRSLAPPSGCWRIGGRGPGVDAVLDPRLMSGTSTGVGRAGVGRSPRETVAVRAGPCVGIASGPTRTELRPKRSIRDGTRWVEGREAPLIRAAPTLSPLGEKDRVQASVRARGLGGGT